MSGLQDRRIAIYWVADNALGRCKRIDTGPRFLPVDLTRPPLALIFEHLLENVLDSSWLGERFCNDNPRRPRQ
jgi:hypothetical protein